MIAGIGIMSVYMRSEEFLRKCDMIYHGQRCFSIVSTRIKHLKNSFCWQQVSDGLKNYQAKIAANQPYETLCENISSW